MDHPFVTENNVTQGILTQNRSSHSSTRSCKCHRSLVAVAEAPCGSEDPVFVSVPSSFGSRSECAGLRRGVGCRGGSVTSRCRIVSRMMLGRVDRTMSRRHLADHAVLGSLSTRRRSPHTLESDLRTKRCLTCRVAMVCCSGHYWLLSRRLWPLTCPPPKALRAVSV